MTFQNPELLWLLCALPLAAFLRGRFGKTAAVRYASVSVARELAREQKRRLGRFLPALRLLAAAAFIVALARPQIVSAKAESQASGVDMVLAVDVSSSMAALDMSQGDQTVDRLTAVKAVVDRFVDDRPNDRIGILAFAGAPYLASPPTLDHAWLKENLARLDTGMVQDGTAIGSALAAGVNRLRGEAAKSKLVILLTDGMNNAGSIKPSLAAQAAKAEGVKVYTIGVGSEGEALLPTRDDQGRQRLVKTQVDVDEPTLRQIADITGGRFFRATDRASLARVYAEIDAMEKTTRTVERRLERKEEFQAPALVGLALFGLDLLGAFALRRQVP
jgi:Ca-activated chloride channel family protein